MARSTNDYRDCQPIQRRGYPTFANHHHWSAKGLRDLWESKYLIAVLQSADIKLAAQWPQGHWPWGELGADVVRIQGGFNNEPFWIMLNAYKVSGNKKYLAFAQRCADLLLTLQRENGGWPDQWSFSGRSAGHSGVRDGVWFNENATNS